MFVSVIISKTAEYLAFSAYPVSTPLKVLDFTV